MAGDAVFGRTFVAVPLVTGGALGLRMLVVQGKTGLVVIESSVAPVLRVMTAVAFSTQIAFVRIVLAVARHTVARGLPVFDTLGMARNTGQLLMLAPEQVIGFCMVKLRLVQLDNDRISPTMIGVA
jgi:hypothetical protein